MRFVDRADAGRQLAEALADRSFEKPIVVALPRGGVPVGFEIARRLGAPLEVFVVRKLGAPLQPELGFGAVAETGLVVVHEWLADELGLSAETIDTIARREHAEALRRVSAYRSGREMPAIRGCSAIVVDDGIATGSTMEVAIAALRKLGPARIVLAVPVAPPETLERLRAQVDDVVAVTAPPQLMSIGQWYERFPQCSDEEVTTLLSRAHAAVADVMPPGREGFESEVGIPVMVSPHHGGLLEGTLTVPANARGLVLFAHGSGSSRHSPRNRAVARALQKAGLATLLFDLLTEREAAIDSIDARHRFDIRLLSSRLNAAVDWAVSQPSLAGLGIGCFGSSTGAAAALVTASDRREYVRAVVSRGGRPDLAMSALSAVFAPTLLLVGERDREVLALNREALEALGGPGRLEVIPGATHLFEEPGTLEEVSRLAAEWFARHLPHAPGRQRVGPRPGFVP